MAKFIGWLILIAFDISVVIYRGFALSTLWTWFIAPLGVREVGIAWGIGISMLVSMMTTNHLVKEKDEDMPALEKAVLRIVTVAIATTFSLIFGYIAHSFM